MKERRHTGDAADAVGSLAAHGHQGLVGDRGKQHARRRRPVDVVVADELLEEKEPRVAEDRGEAEGDSKGNEKAAALDSGRRRCRDRKSVV